MTDPSHVRVGLVGGTRLPGNVRTLLTNVRNLLQPHPRTFELELVVSDSVDAPDGYSQVDPGFADMNRALGTLKTLTSGLTKYARGREIDLLFQVTKFPLHGCATAVAGKRTETPVLTRFAGDNFREFRLSSGLDAVKAFGLNNVIGRVPIHWSDRVIVLGPYGRSEIERRNDDIPIDEIPQPLDREQFQRVSDERERDLAHELGFPANERALLTVGRLTERKGMRTLIKTAEELSDRGEHFRWYVVGDGPMRQELADTRSVEPVGRVPFDRMADYYHAADLVIHPSLIEGLPNVLLEATACGTPTVARDVGDSAMAASATFEDDAKLPDLLSREHGPAVLSNRFDLERLREAYAEALIETLRVH